MSKGFYRELVKTLKFHGCYFVAPAKDSHEKWFSPISNKLIIVPHNCLSAHTANAILCDAGLPKQF